MLVACLLDWTASSDGRARTELNCRSFTPTTTPTLTSSVHSTFFLSPTFPPSHAHSNSLLPSRLTSLGHLSRLRRTTPQQQQRQKQQQQANKNHVGKGQFPAWFFMNLLTPTPTYIQTINDTRLTLSGTCWHHAGIRPNLLHQLDSLRTVNDF